ncbi:hypothetical protein EV714DRAFT_277780 [Schizophyllum commune]
MSQPPRQSESPEPRRRLVKPPYMSRLNITSDSGRYGHHDERLLSRQQHRDSILYGRRNGYRVADPTDIEPEDLSSSSTPQRPQQNASATPHASHPMHPFLQLGYTLPHASSSAENGARAKLAEILELPALAAGPSAQYAATSPNMWDAAPSLETESHPLLSTPNPWLESDEQLTAADASLDSSTPQVDDRPYTHSMDHNFSFRHNTSLQSSTYNSPKSFVDPSPGTPRLNSPSTLRAGHSLPSPETMEFNPPPTPDYMQPPSPSMSQATGDRGRRPSPQSLDPPSPDLMDSVPTSEMLEFNPPPTPDYMQPPSPSMSQATGDRGRRPSPQSFDPPSPDRMDSVPPSEMLEFNPPPTPDYMHAPSPSMSDAAGGEGPLDDPMEFNSRPSPTPSDSMLFDPPPTPDWMHTSLEPTVEDAGDLTLYDDPMVFAPPPTPDWMRPTLPSVDAFEDLAPEYEFMEFNPPPSAASMNMSLPPTPHSMTFRPPSTVHASPEPMVVDLPTRNSFNPGASGSGFVQSSRMDEPMVDIHQVKQDTKAKKGICQSQHNRCGCRASRTRDEEEEDDGDLADIDEDGDRALADSADSEELFEELLERLKKKPKSTPLTRADFALFVATVKQAFEASGKTPWKRLEEQKTYEKRRRPQRRKLLVALVREQTRESMQRSRKEPLRNDHLPHPEDLKQFELTGDTEYGPTIHNLKIDIGRGGTAGPWNDRAAELFAPEFLSKYDVDEVTDWTETEIQAAFKSHLRNLRREMSNNLKADLNPRYDTKEVQSRARRKARAYNEYNRRINGWRQFATDESVKPHLKFWREHHHEDLVSDSYSDYEGGKHYFCRAVAHHRNPALSAYFRLPALLQLASHYQDDGRKTVGHLPHFRDYNPRPRLVRKERTPIGLPQNFYDPAFLERLPLAQRRALKIAPSMRVDFPAYILRHASRFAHIKSDNDVPAEPSDWIAPELVCLLGTDDTSTM